MLFFWHLSVKLSWIPGIGTIRITYFDITLFSHNCVWYFNRNYLCSHVCGYWLSIPAHYIITCTWITSDSSCNLICIPILSCRYLQILVYIYIFFSCSLSYLTENIKDVPKCSFEGWFSHTSRTPGSNVRLDQFYPVH